jgi:uncharacterized membrane protein YgcG
MAMNTRRWFVRGLLVGLIATSGMLLIRVLRGGTAQRVYDHAGVLDPAELPLLNQYLQQIRDESGADLRFLLVDSVQGSLEAFALRQARALGVGRETDRRGALFVYDVREHRLRVEVGPNLEPIFTDLFVSYLMREHVRSFFAAGSPTLGLRLTLFMLHARLRRAALGEDYDPRAAEFVEERNRLALGGGATAVMPVTGGRADFANADAQALEVGYFAAQQSVEAAYLRYLEWLRWPAYLPKVPLFTPESQAYLSKLPMTLPYKDYILLLEYGRPHLVLERGDLALMYFTDDPLPCPHFLRRGSMGWQMDIVAEVQHTRNFAGGPYTWGMLEADDDFTKAFGDQLLAVGPVLRVRGGDNRALPTLRKF